VPLIGKLASDWSQALTFNDVPGGFNIQHHGFTTSESSLAASQ
jgi:hypothetical protein